MSRQLTRRKTLVTLSGGAAAFLTAKQATAVSVSESALPEPTESSWASFRNGPAQRGVARTQLAVMPELKWEVVSRDGWLATCAIVGDHVYAPALQGYLFCFDRESGAELWRYRTIESTDEKKFAPGFKAAPLVAGKAVYVGDEDGILHAVDRVSGEQLWTYATDAEIAGGVAVYQDKLLLASHDAFLYCLTKQGGEHWTFETNDRINCSPGVAEHFTFVSGCDEHLRVIDLNSGKETRDVPMESYLIASPAIVDEMLYVGSQAGIVSGVNWKTGEIKWRYENDRSMPYHASASVTDDLVLVGSHDKKFHAIDRHSGKGRWTFLTKGRIECSSAVVDSRVFFGSRDGNIYGLAIPDGKEVWKFNAGKSITAGVSIGEGCMVVGEDDHNGKLRCFA
ncbi:MAG: PQQ-binding-like beta-propeller repeat protein [Fuerstiella sp.]|nr:PQQ-binding-like beta-propeller repeat protein [Fuerstiella sp.]